MAAFLVAHRRLTNFQAECLLANPAVPLQFAGFRLRDRETPPPFSKWIAASRLQPDPADPSSGGYLLRSRSIDERFSAVANNHRAGLAPIHIVPQGDHSAIYLPLGGGRPIETPSRGASSAEGPIKEKPHDVLRRFANIIRSWRDWTQSVGPHGRVTEERIWRLNEQSWLLWEPAPDSWFDPPQRFKHSLAPEQWDRGSAPTIAGDAYALGCLLYRQIHGREAFEPTAAAHRGPLPAEVQAAVQQGAAGNPTLRLTAHLLSRDATARLSAADQIVQAVDAILSAAAKSSASNQSSPASSSTPPQPVDRERASSSPKAATMDPGSSKAARKVADPKPPRRTAESSKLTATDKPKRPKASGTGEPAAAAKPTAPKPSPAAHRAGPTEQNPVTPSAADIASGTLADVPPPLDTPPKAASTQIDRASSVQSGFTESASTKAEPAVSVPPESPASKAASRTSARPSSDTPIADASSSNGVEPATVATDAQTMATDVGTMATDAADDSVATKRLPRRRRRRPLARIILAAMALIVVGQIIYLAVADTGPYVVVRKPRPEPPRNLPPVLNTSRSVVETAASVPVKDGPTAAPYQVVEDTRLLFVPPEVPAAASDAPDPLMWLPDGVSSVIAARPSRWSRSNAAATLFDAFGNQWREWLGDELQIAGASLEHIDTLSIGLYAGDDGSPKAVGWIRLVDGMDVNSISKGWSAAPDELPGKISVLRFSDDWVHHIPEEPQSIHYLFGDPDLVRSAVRGEGAMTTLPLSMARLWKQIPADGDLVLAAIPNFFFSDGRRLLENGLPDWNDALRRFMVPDVAAMTLWIQADQDLIYAESRMLPSAGLTEAGLLGQWSRWWMAMPESAQQQTESIQPTEAMSPLAQRFPAMVDFLTSGTRFGIDDGSVTANAYLPANPFAQLGMTGVLLASAPEKPTAAERVAGRAEPKTAEEMLAVPMTIAFAQEALKPAVESVVAEFARELADGIMPPTIEIRGGDLQKNGITQNQQIRDFEQTERPLGEVLTALVMAANPDKTVTAASQPEQMLVWVLDPAAESPTIFITTRDAATANDWPLPTAFVPEN